jgi:hypothetical protein
MPGFREWMRVSGEQGRFSRDIKSRVDVVYPGVDEICREVRECLADNIRQQKFLDSKKKLGISTSETVLSCSASNRC